MPISNSPTSKFFQEPGGASPPSGTDQDTSINSTLSLIRMCLPDYIPDSMKTKPFYEIANYKNEQGVCVGIRALREAWLAAQSLVTTANPLNTTDDGAKLREILIDLASLSSGSGRFDSQFQSVMTGFDKYGKSMLSPNIEMPGLTFFSRPRLCLQSSNLRNNPIMAPLDTADPNSTAFAIRSLLDTNLDGSVNFRNYARYHEAIHNSPLLNPESPWLIPLSNTLMSISGFPDYDMTTEATEGGWFSEQQQYAAGADDFNRGGTLSLTFREMPGGFISALFHYWLEYIRCVVRGDMLAYADDIDGQIMNYTVSIYSFNMDPSMQYITRWVKCTGCFPKSLPIGQFMNKSNDQYFIDSTKTVEVQFVVNKFEYMKPQCLLDFNTLAMRYCPMINSRPDGSFIPTPEDGRPPSDIARPAIPDSTFSNFCGLPFIISDENGYRLVFRESTKDLFADPVVRKLIATDVIRNEREWQVGADNKYSALQQYDYNDFYRKDVASAKSPDSPNPFTFDAIIKSIQDGTFLNAVTPKE